MLVITPSGHPTPWSRQRRGLRWTNTEALGRDHAEAVMALADSLCRLRVGTRHTAVARLSAGGGQAQHCSAGNLSRCRRFGAFISDAPSPEVSAPVPQAANGRPEPLRIAIERDEFLLKRNRRLTSQLEAARIRHAGLLAGRGHGGRDQVAGSQRSRSD